MTDPREAVNVEALVAETRARREALQELVKGIRRERRIVEAMLAELPDRPRLTVRQQARLRAHLAKRHAPPPAEG